MISIKIKSLAQAKDFKNAYRLQLAAELAPHVAQRLWKGEVEKISMETLNRLCRALACQPGDLFIYEPDAETQAGRMPGKDDGSAAACRSMSKRQKVQRSSHK